ncbi:MAG: thiolase family protein, partial [Mycobacterium sp.]|nr:thiolase family protein [Mycobacterium sp.]
GKCRTMAVIFTSSFKAAGRTFGGTTFVGSQRDSYYYYHPWGWSSQAAHWALMARRYMIQYGTTEADLGEVAVLLREYAAMNDNATMRAPLTIEQYLDSRYIADPLHLLDMCLVNDGAVCLILRRKAMTGGFAHTPVYISGWGDTEVTERKMQTMVQERLRPQLEEAGRIAFEMAGISRSDVQHFQGYDAASIHLINQIEGYGFVEPGQGLAFWKDGGTRLDGDLPVNTSGGMLSEAYLLGWNHIAEAVRQLRHEAGARQVTDVEISMSSLCTTESAHPLIFKRGE